MTAAKVPVPPPMSIPRRIAEFADLAICMNWGIGRSSSVEKVIRDFRWVFRSNPMLGCLLERQENDLQA